MNEDELRELMEEPAGGHNHGWKRDGRGGWISNSTVDWQTGMEYAHRPPTPITPRSPKSADEIKHGTRGAYQNDGCRCDECRKAEAEYRARYRRRRRVT